MLIKKGKALLTYLNAKYYSVVNPDSSNIANFMPILLNLSQCSSGHCSIL
jgi:hypothetical protein